MTFQIEKVDSDELRAFLRLQAEDSFPDLKDEDRLKMLAEKWANNAECATCRDNDGNWVGMIAFYANGQGADFAYIPHVYVLPEYRKKGLFTLMLDIVAKHVRAKGYTEIRLEVEKGNRIAQKTYLKNGFFMVGLASARSMFMQKKLMG